MLRELEPLATSWGAYAIAVGFGLLWGSFANVCIYRWPPTEAHPKGRSVVKPGSHCSACQAPIRWYDNVPLLSYLWLRGKCRACQAPFSARYLVVEAVTGLLFGIAWWATVDANIFFETFDQRLIRFAVSAAFSLAMVVIAFIDLDHKLILDKVTIPSIIIFYGLGLLAGRTWEMGLIGALIGFGVPWAVGEIYFIVTDRDGLGLGDSMLLAVVGALLGWRGVAASLSVGAMIGAVIGTLVLLRSGPDIDESAEPAPDEPAPSQLPRVLAVGAVGGTIVATAAALQGWTITSIIGAVCALALLVISRRIETVRAGDGEPATRRLPRLLALLSAVIFVLAASATVLQWTIAAIACAAGGVGVLLLARRLHASATPEDTAETDIPHPAPEQSLLRTELPFGPFLAIGALFYLFGEPWIILQFRFAGG